MEYGILCVLPVITILVIAVTTKRTLFAMTCGLSMAALILGKGQKGFAGSFFDNIYAAFSNDSLQWLLIVIALFGILIMLYERTGAVTDFGYWAGKFIKTKKTALFGTFILGVIIFIDDYLNNLAVGTTMKGITDKLGIPRQQLAYVVNTVAAPVCLLIPLSSWAVYFATLMGDQGVEINGSSMAAYIHGLPLAFYAWFAVIICILQILGVIPKIGPMKKAYERYETLGDVFPEGTDPELVESSKAMDDDEEDHSKAHPWNFLIPLIVMIIVALLADVLMGSAAGVAVAFILYLIEKKMSFKDLLTTCFDGVMSMGFVFILSVLAFSVQNANIELGLADYIISVTEPVMKGGFLPAVVFIVCGIYAYATGCFWDLAAIIIPIVIPLANAMGVDPIVTSAAVFSGAAFGSNTCLYGDGVVVCTGLSDQEPRPHDNYTALCGDSRGSNSYMLAGSRIRYVGSHIYRIYKIVAPGYGTAVFFLQEILCSIF